MRRICRAEATRATLKVATRRFPSSTTPESTGKASFPHDLEKGALTTASRHPHFEAAPEGARRRTCKGEQQRFPRKDRRLSAYQAAEAYRLTACSGRLWRSENALPVNPPLYILRRIGRVGRSLRLWMQACGQAFMVRGCAGCPS